MLCNAMKQLAAISGLVINVDVSSVLGFFEERSEKNAS